MSDPQRTPPIRLGDEGAPVSDLQRRLVRLGEQDLEVDGRFGPVTLEAVRRFQREHGLAADGVVGPETWRRLVEAGWALGDRLLYQRRVMLRGEDVLELQQRLSRLGFDAGPEDGIFGPLLHAAVEEFQRNAGLEVDGVAGPATVAALRRLHRDHQRGGHVARLREREALRRLVHRGLAGARVVVDPAHGPDDPGVTGPGGTREHDVTWEIARRLVARLSARGVHAVLSRGHSTTPPPSERARFANEQGADALVGIGLSGHPTPAATGSSAYYFGSPTFVSEAGELLAGLCQEELVTAGARPDGRCHPVTWTVLRETRMPAIVVEPGFLTSPRDEARLTSPEGQEAIAEALLRGIARFLEPRPGD
ncbi:MAG TPA: peptidoglycan-binding protein [Egibacteraceae bacterium]|nr:peptidoglycan-binding protein [Egibacteraceae bacterium]